MRSIAAVLFGVFIIFASIIVASIAIRSLESFASDSFFQSDIQAQIQTMTIGALIPIAFGLILIIFGAWPQQEISRTTQPPSMTQPENPQIVEKEVIVAKIRCAYCKTLYDETLDRCPYCGATH